MHGIEAIYYKLVGFVIYLYREPTVIYVLLSITEQLRELRALCSLTPANHRAKAGAAV